MNIAIAEFFPANCPDDLDVVVQAYLAIWNHPDNHRFLTFTGQLFEENQLRDWCSCHIEAGVRYFGATVQEEQLVGLLLTRASPIEGFELLSIGVSPTQKRQGIGTKLVLYGIRAAEAQSYRAVDCQVYAINVAMLCLLLNLNFLPIRIDYHRGPQGEDLIHLKKYL